MLMNTVKRLEDFTVTGGEGCVLQDETRGKTLLDFYSDTGTASLGYHTQHHKNVLRLMLLEGVAAHVPNILYHELREEVAAALCERTGMDKVFFCTSGAESVEAAIKAARKTQADRGMPHRQTVYSVPNGFHGRTLGALAASDGPVYHYAGFGPMPSGFQKFSHISDIRTDAAAVIIAPVFGNGDVREYNQVWLKKLETHCRLNGIILIHDEVQTGSGRTSAGWLYGDTVGVKPDIVCLAKGMAMGQACGAMLARGDVANAFTPGSHYTTFGGQPWAMSFVRGMVQYLDHHGLDTPEKGAYLIDALARSEKINALGLGQSIDIRGPGLMVGFDVAVDKLAFVEACQRRGLLVAAFRAGPGAVKLTPPLIVDRGQIDLAVHIMEAAAVEVLGGAA